jgi:hypothetical protein
VYAHVQRISLPPRLRLIKDKIIIIYPVLAEYLLTFVVAAKYSEAMEAVIQCIQAIKQAAIPSSQFPQSPHRHHPCQNEVPHLAITNEVFRMWSQKKVYTHSRPQFSFRGMLYPSQIVGLAPPVRRASVPIELEDKMIDVNVLMDRKPRNDAGDISLMSPAYTPYYPQVPNSFA